MSDYDFTTSAGQIAATYSFRITGPEGEGIVKVEIVQFEDGWQYKKFRVIFEDGTVLDLWP